jgi:hypothetical protein
MSQTETNTKETTRWKDYYMRNRDKIKTANLARYYARAGRVPPPPRAPAPPPVDDEAVKRLEALVAELRALIPKAMKPPKKSRSAKATAATAIAVKAIVDQAHEATAGCTPPAPAPAPPAENGAQN